jgi:hypothetical protein
MSAADQAAMDRRMKLELWKAQKEAEKAVKGQVRSSRARPRAALSAAGLVRPSHPIAACGVQCAHALLAVSRHVPRWPRGTSAVLPCVETRGRTADVPRGPRARSGAAGFYSPARVSALNPSRVRPIGWGSRVGRTGRAILAPKTRSRHHCRRPLARPSLTSSGIWGCARRAQPLLACAPRPVLLRLANLL